MNDDQFDDAQISLLQSQLIVVDVPQYVIPYETTPQQRTGEILTGFPNIPGNGSKYTSISVVGSWAPCASWTCYNSEF